MLKKALIVDNDFFFVEFLTELLEDRGFEVIKAYDGKEGVSKLEEGPVDILFVEMIMPKIDGEQVVKYALKKFPDIEFPKILMSGTLIERMDEVNKIEADYYVAKGPMDMMAGYINEFLDKIEKEPVPDIDEDDLLEPGKVYPRQATATLMDIVRYQRAITESLGVGVVVVDRDARIISANSMALKIIGAAHEDVLNYPILNVFPKGEKAKLVEALKGILHDKELEKIPLLIDMPPQEIRTIISVLKVDGEIAGWILAMETTLGEGNI